MFATGKWMRAAALAVAGVAVAGAALAQESTMERVKRTKEVRIGTVAGAIPYFNKDLVTQKWEGFGPDFAESLGKQVVMAEDEPGFVVNRILLPMINEAVFVLGQGTANIADIDKGCRLGLNHPMGPLELGDYIGLDICLSVMETLYREFGDQKYRPHPLLRKMVRAGQLGCKSGQGFYSYANGEKTPVDEL